MEHVCIVDDCGQPADYALVARWRDGQTWRRDVCLVHMAHGVASLLQFRGAEAGEPVITQVALSE
jgi:hypothetical protein